MRVFFYLNYLAIFVYLILVQFVQSDIVNNDFGWRTVMVPIMLLLIWAAVLLTELPLSASNWRPVALKLSRQYFFIPLVWAGITIGVMASFFSWHWPKPYPAPSLESLALHQDLYKLDTAWQAVRQYTQYNDLVQSNPDGYTKVLTL